jgi:hypothetical protein
VHADARTYVPDGPVDVVLCEMMHVGQLREKQIEVIGGFAQRYAAAGLGPMPRFLPEACLQAVQPVEQDFTFHGYTVAAPYFQDPFCAQPRTTELAAPAMWQSFCYDEQIPTTCTADLAVPRHRAAAAGSTPCARPPRQRPGSHPVHGQHRRLAHELPVCPCRPSTLRRGRPCPMSRLRLLPATRSPHT